MFKEVIGGSVSIGSAMALSLAFSLPVQAGDCGGNNPGIPCSCGDNVVASRTLSPSKKNPDPVVKTLCVGHGLIINTPGVVLGLGGGKIQGSSKANTVGVLIAADNVTVRGGAIFYFGTGVGGTTSGSTIGGMSLKYNEGEGIFLEGDDNTVNASPARHNVGNGFTVIGDNNTLSGSNNEYNGGDGIYVQGSGNELIALKASENRRGGNGIVVIGDNNIIRQSAITKLNTNGIVVEGDNNTLIQNSVTKQKGRGITVDGDNNVLTDNTATLNHGPGIKVVGFGTGAASAGNHVSGNQTPQCEIYGVTTPPTCIQGSAP